MVPHHWCLLRKYWNQAGSSFRRASWVQEVWVGDSDGGSLDDVLEQKHCRVDWILRLHRFPEDPVSATVFVCACVCVCDWRLMFRSSTGGERAPPIGQTVEAFDVAQVSRGVFAMDFNSNTTST